MKAKNSQVISAVLQLSSSYSEITPETVIYGFSKLLTMDESQIKSMLDGEDFRDLESAHKWFAKNGVDLKLIKSGLSMLINCIPQDETRKKNVEKFQKFLETGKDADSAEKVLNQAKELACVPVCEVFRNGNGMDEVFKYQVELKKLRDDAKGAGGKEEQDSEAADGSKKDKLDLRKKINASRGKKIEEKEPEGTDDENEKESGSSEKAEEAPVEVEERDLSELAGEYKKLNSALLDVVKGQDVAVMKFIQGYNQGELLKQTERGKHPRSYFFFFGPPGVGKTLLAETAAETLGRPFKAFTMSEYSSPSSHEDFIGTSKIYNNAREGTLVDFVRKNPECVLIFDEIEKAHLNVIRLFLQILGSGKLHSMYRDEDVSFQDATIIFTSNVGRELYADRSQNLTSLPEKVLVDAIQREKNAYGGPALPPEICSRIASGNTVMFNHLSVRHLAEMVNANFEKIVNGIREEYGVNVTYSSYLPLLFLYNRGGELDARVATGQSGKFFKDEIFELLRQMENRKTETKLESISIDVQWDDMDAELRRLFQNEETSEVLFFTSKDSEIPAAINSDKYRVHCVSTIDEAKEILKGDIKAVYIDPFFGNGETNETILSIADYNTDGVRLFHEIAGNEANLPIYMLETNGAFSEVDRLTFLQEGAAGTATMRSGQTESFKREFKQTLEAIYMETESQSFSQRGWVIDFNTKQEISAQGDQAKILFYDLKKRMAVDMESRGSILSDAERPNICFDDVIGAEKAKEELKYFVNYLKKPKQFLLSGGKPPKGVLLYGPPGTGKTMLAKAMAGESDVTFLQTSASEFKNKYIGESEANIRRIFQKAKKYAPAIIFIDEIDAIGKKRTGSENTAHTESMLNALLTEMDGFVGADSTKPIFVLAATNFGVGSEQDGISSLDDALIRRFDNKIYVDLPNESERKLYIMRTLAKKGVTTVSEAIAQSIAERTTGQSLAILQNVIDLAFRNATKESRCMVDGDLLTALEEYNYGEKREHTPDYYRSVAIHETGHAYVAYISGEKPSYITIESRGNFGGYMGRGNLEDKPSFTKEEMLGQIRTALAGRAAEIVFYDKELAVNTGASSDLAAATNTAFRLLCTYGMGENQLVVLKKDDILKSPLASEYVTKVNDLLNQEMENTIKIIEGAKDKIQAIAEVLIRENRLTGKQFDDLMTQG